FKLIISVVVVIPFCIVIVSYIYILVTIFEIPSINGRKKTFSTCSSHLTVVSIYYGTLFGVYIVPNRGQSWNMAKFVALLYTIVTPLMNPIIYSLRNNNFKQALGKLISFSSSYNIFRTFILPRPPLTYGAVAFPVLSEGGGVTRLRTRKNRSVTRQKTPTEADRVDGAEKKPEGRCRTRRAEKEEDGEEEDEEDG
ncbi:hypothetical protein AB205_0064550, partial [Aquarana catesbeiana]